VSSWRKRLGARLLTERVQEKTWNVSEAAEHAGVDPGTIGRIERGENYSVIKLEQYALALGRDIETWLREILEMPERSPHGHEARRSDPLPSGEASAPIKRRRRKGG